ncbi:MAG: TIGR03790 family protein [Desulfuromonadaceae bacterium]
MPYSFFWVFLLVLMLSPFRSFGLEPEEVAVVANRFVEESTELARYYMEKRGIPEENLILIKTTDKNFCSRKEFDNEIAGPVREFLRKREPGTIRCLVTMLGVPLKVEPPLLNREEKKSLEALKTERTALKIQLKQLKNPKSAEAARLQAQDKELSRKIAIVGKSNQRVAVDSELTLVLKDGYPLDSWVLNPYFLGFQRKAVPFKKEDVVWVARLDAPSEQIVKRIIDDSIATEAKGLTGKAYFDARWKKPDKEKLKGYAYYDNALHLTAERVKSKRPAMPTILDDRQELFQAGEAPDAALYCGWYSANRYVDAFDWKPGAVGYHIASGECATLRAGSSQGWCKRMLEDGVAATIGPVSEPYVQAFPVPELFCGSLIDGYYSLVEAYFLSLPYLSWQMVLVGDPLYRPFKNNGNEQHPAQGGH